MTILKKLTQEDQNTLLRKVKRIHPGPNQMFGNFEDILSECGLEIVRKNAG